MPLRAYGFKSHPRRNPFLIIASYYSFVKFLKDVFYSTGGYILSRILSLVKEFILAKVLGPTSLGLRNTIVYFHNLSVYSLLGVPISLFKKVSKGEDILPLAWSYSTLIGVFLSILGIFLYLLTPQPYGLGLLLLSLLIIPRLQAPLINFYLTAKSQFKQQSLVEGAVLFLNLILSVSLAYIYGYLGALIGLFLSILSRSLWFIHVYKVPFRIYPLNDYLTLLKSSLPYFFLTISNLFLTQVDKLLIVLFLTASDMGVYGLAFIFYSSFQSVLSSAIKPYVTKVMGDPNHPSFINFSKALLLISFGLWLLSQPVVQFIHNFYSEYTQLTSVYFYLSISILFGPLSQLYISYLISNNKDNAPSYIILFAGIINLILGLYLIQIGYGLEGVALTTAISSFITLILLLLHENHLFKLSKSLLLVLIGLVAYWINPLYSIPAFIVSLGWSARILLNLLNSKNSHSL